MSPPVRDPSRTERPILLLAQGHAGDRLGAGLVPALRATFPERPLAGIGGPRMAAAGVRLLARTEGLSAMGWSGLLPKLPTVLLAIRRLANRTRRPRPACVVAIDIWQPLRALHRFGPHLAGVPHVCYLPPGPNFIGPARVHAAASAVFHTLVTPFPHQARLYREAGGRVRLAAHAGLLACRTEATPRPPTERENLLAILPGSRALEVRHSLAVQLAAAARIRERHPELEPVLCCADDATARLVQAWDPTLRRSRNAREVLARARLGIICSGTAALEAAILGCPGVVTYHGSRLQRWEWERFHVPALARLRAAGIASPYVALPNILAGEALYPELLGAPPDAIAKAALDVLAAWEADPQGRGAALERVAATLAWDDPGVAVAEAVRAAMEASG